MPTLPFKFLWSQHSHNLILLQKISQPVRSPKVTDTFSRNEFGITSTLTSFYLEKSILAMLQGTTEDI